MTPGDLRYLAECASHAAREAGGLIAASRPEHIHRKSTGQTPASQIVTDIDRQAEALILRELAATVARFDFGLLTEEQPDSGLRLKKPYFWSIDPLDGTLPFIEGIPGYAVSIALVSRDGVPKIGVVYDPLQDTLYCAILGLGVTRNESPLQSASPSRNLTVYFDRSFVGSENYENVVGALQGIASDLGLDGLTTRAQAGAVMNACQVLENPPACYFKLPKTEDGGGSLWDFAATACLFREAGAVATDIHGEPLDLNRPDSTFMNHRGVLFATDRSLADRVRALYQD
jgi:fructose-1,6-bisphosphatase/inositol monophosphatase family enzyme